MKGVSTRQLLVTFVPSLSILAIIVFVSVIFEVNVHDMAQEGAILSDLGIILWCAAASVCFFAATTLRNRKPADMFRFLFCSALLTTYLLFDDFFQIHEVFVPRYLGLDEKIVYMILGIIIIVYLVVFRRVISQANYTMLLFALGFFGTSVAADGIFAPIDIIYVIMGTVLTVSVYLIAFNRTIFRAHFGVLLLISGLCATFFVIKSRVGQPEYLLEDGTKWLGIACWCSYYVHTSHQFIARTFSEKSADPGIISEAEFPD